MRTLLHRPRRRLSVTAYLLVAFGTCTVVLVAVVAQSTRLSFERERTFARQSLRAITQEVQSANSSASPDETQYLAEMVTDPRLLSLDPTKCLEVFDGFRSFLTSEHLHVVRADGSEVCSVFGSQAEPQPIDTSLWLRDLVATGAPYTSEPTIDGLTGRPVRFFAVPLKDASGVTIGVFAAVTSIGRSAITIPADAPAGAVILLLDSDRNIVLGASANAPAQPGDQVGDTALGSVTSGRSITDLDGQQRMYEDVTIAANGWHVLAGVPSDVAFASARKELRRNEIAGAFILGVVFLLGGLLHRRLARPIRQVGRAISASLDGDSDARAPIGGPSEVAHVARAFNDLIEERQEQAADLWLRARRDSLTGLPNRTALTEHLQATLKRSEGNPDQRVAVLFLDLDRFKHINDAYGHATGDRVLTALGERLQESMPDIFVSRFGGDEYVMVAIGDFDSESAAELASRVAATMGTPIDVDESALHLTGSVGIAIARPGDTAGDLIRNADTAMYRSKENGTDGFAVFDQPMRDWVMHRASLERDLHQAIESGELWLSYQPKLDLAGGGAGAAGFEALARWSHPERGLVPPAEFIPVAEETGLISTIGNWALEEASRQAATWRKLNGGLAVPIAVNLAARQLADPHLPDIIARTLEVAGAEPNDLVIEVTESAVLFDTEGVSQRLRRLRDAGVRVSIDDFGTGYSSLGYLQMLPIDELKIDRAFVSRLPFEQSSAAIIGSIIDLAHAIGLSVVAEGVETVQQLDLLRALGCDLAQGFYIARPAPAADATVRLKAEIDGSAAGPALVIPSWMSGATYL